MDEFQNLAQLVYRDEVCQERGQERPWPLMVFQMSQEQSGPFFCEVGVGPDSGDGGK